MPSAEFSQEKKYAYTAIIERIREMIRNGELAPGDRLPPERKLARILRGFTQQSAPGISGAGRAADSRKQARGRHLSPRRSLTPPSLAMPSWTQSVSRVDFSTTLSNSVRIMEPQIAALAAQRIKPESIDRLKILVCDQQRALLAGREDDTLMSEFHQSAC